MNKKVENAKVDKITDDQLKDLQAHVSRINQTQMDLGRLTVQTQELTYLVPQLKKQLKDFQDKLEEQYGVEKEKADETLLESIIRNINMSNNRK